MMSTLRVWTMLTSVWFLACGARKFDHDDYRAAVAYGVFAIVAALLFIGTSIGRKDR